MHKIAGLSALVGRNNQKKLSLLKDYHKRYLKGYSDEYIRDLLSLLDIKTFVDAVDEPDSAGFVYRLDNNTVKCSAPELVDLYYLMCNTTINQVIGGSV